MTSAKPKMGVKKSAASTHFGRVQELVDRGTIAYELILDLKWVNQ